VPTLDVFFEFASTYSYPATSRVEALCAAADVPMRWRPFLLGPIFRGQGWNDSPFNVYPVKGQYMWRDMERICGKLDLPLQRPTQFPRNGLLAARVACAVAAESWCGDFVRAMYRANFAEDRDIARPEVVGAVLEALGQKPEPILERAGTQETKDRLRLETDEAVRLGVFGAPSFVVDGELFWGNDRLEDALAWARR
jgi:2-hydroxychromene-2-carboxylate isomerase